MMTRTIGLKRLLASGAAALAIAAGATSAAAAQDHAFHIPAGDLKAALDAYIAQSGDQLIYRREDVAGRTTQGVDGRIAPTDALDRLLAGTGLSVHRDASGAEVITKAPLSQTGADEPSQVSELVVTAEKRTERAKDVPISMVVMGNEELRKREIVTLDGLANSVPGLAVQNDGPSTRVTIRGIANVYGNSSLIGLYVDEADVTSAGNVQPNLNTYDLNHVEVLRGPQGTLYGEGSAGGTVRFITNDPELGRYDASVDAGLLFTQDGSPSERVNGMVNVPVSENFGLRIAAVYDHEGGWVNQPALGKKDINDENLADVRVKALWRPTADFTLTGMAEIHRNHEGSGLGEDSQGNYTQFQGFATTPRITDDYDIYNVTGSYDAGPVRIVDTATYLKLDRDTRAFGAVEPLTAGGIPYLSLYIDPDIYRVSNFTDELRISSKDGGPLNWVAGGFYKHSTLNVAEDGFAALEPGPIFVLPVSVRNQTVSNAWSVFGDLNYTLDRLTVGAGGRYFHDDQKYASGTPSVEQNGSFHSFDPRVYAKFKLSDETNLYASASKGFRSGGFNSLGEPAFGPEEVWTYEFGTKFSLPVQGLTGDVALFYSDYRNYQVDVLPLGATVFETLNVGKARIKGVEWDLSWRPNEHWLFSVNGDYISDRFYSVIAAASPFAVDDPLPLFPNYAFTVSAERDFEVSGRPAYVRLDYSQQGKETYRDRTVGPWLYSESDVLNLLNLKAGVQLTDRIAVDVFAQNLLNDRGQIDPFGVEAQAMRERPRTYGLEFSAKY